MASDNTISKSTTPTDKSGTAHSFLKSFPRELRDQIYNLLSQEREDLIKNYSRHPYLFRIRTTLPKVRLLNRQIKEEYDARPLADNHLEVIECQPDDVVVHLLPREIPPLAVRTTVLHLDLVCCKDPADSAMKCLEPRRCCNGTIKPWAGEELRESHGRYIIKCLIPHLPLLERATIRLSCSNMSCVTALQSTDEPWNDIAQLSQIELLRNVYDHDLSRDYGDRLDEYQTRDLNPSKSPEFFQNRETMATWTPAHGWKADEKVMEDCRNEEAVFMSGRVFILFIKD
jgi:hypothetical protein